MYRQIRHVCEAQKQPVEDKLSVKNLIFHSVKNALATLDRSKKMKNGLLDEDTEEPDEEEDTEDMEAKS
jgi:hypothetical protein